MALWNRSRCLRFFFVTCTLCEVKKLSPHSVFSTQLNGNNFQEEKWSFTWFSYSIQGAAYRPYSVFRIPGIRFQSLLVELGFWISIVSGILDSLRYIFRIPKPRIPVSRSKISRIPDSTAKSPRPRNPDSLPRGEMPIITIILLKAL